MNYQNLLIRFLSSQQYCANLVSLLSTNLQPELENQSLLARIIRQYNSNDCLVCRIYKGQRGIKRKATNPSSNPNSSTPPNPKNRQFHTPMKCRKCLCVKKVHNCTKRNTVQNIIGTINRKGLNDTVVSSILR